MFYVIGSIFLLSTVLVLRYSHKQNAAQQRVLESFNKEEPTAKKR